MKTFIMCLATIAASTGCFSQNINTGMESTPSRAAELQLKAKHQKSAAWGLLGGGVVVMGVGLAIFPKDYNIFAGFLSEPNSRSTESRANLSGIVTLIGGAAAMSSIPLFIASGRNKKKARVLLENERLDIPGKTGAVLNKFGLGISI